MRLLRRVVEHPLTNLAVAVILIVTSLAEDWTTLQEDLIHLNVGVHHGVLVLGFVKLLRVLPDLFGAAESVSKASERAS